LKHLRVSAARLRNAPLGRVAASELPLLVKHRPRIAKGQLLGPALEAWGIAPDEEADPAPVESHRIGSLGLGVLSDVPNDPTSRAPQQMGCVHRDVECGIAENPLPRSVLRTWNRL